MKEKPPLELVELDERYRGAVETLDEAPREVPFHPEASNQWRLRYDHASRGLRELPGDVVRIGRDFAFVLRRDLFRERLQERRERGYEAVEIINHTYFAGFEREFRAIPYDGESHYRAAVMYRQGDHPERQQRAIIGIHGWFGRYESFAEQAGSSYLREFTQIYYNRVGTDAGESSGIIRELGHSPEKHMQANIDLLVGIMDDAVEQGVEDFVFVGHSCGGMVDRRALQFMKEHRPDLYRRVAGTISANTSVNRNVIQDSFLDRVPFTPEAARFALNNLGRVMVPLTDALNSAYRLLPDGAARRARPYTPSRIMGLAASGTYIEHVLGDLHGPVIDASRYRAEQNDPLAMLADGLMMLNLSDAEQPSQKPHLIVEGKHDGLMAPLAAHKLARAAIGGRQIHPVRHLVFNTGHCTPIEAPQEFNSVLYRFTDQPAAYLKSVGPSRLYRQRQDRRRPAAVASTNGALAA